MGELERTHHASGKYAPTRHHPPPPPWGPRLPSNAELACLKTPLPLDVYGVEDSSLSYSAVSSFAEDDEDLYTPNPDTSCAQDDELTPSTLRLLPAKPRWFNYSAYSVNGCSSRSAHLVPPIATISSVTSSYRQCTPPASHPTTFPRSSDGMSYDAALSAQEHWDLNSALERYSSGSRYALIYSTASSSPVHQGPHKTRKRGSNNQHSCRYQC
jgi:hypothetical protein